VRAFIQAGSAAAVTAEQITPTTEQIATILAPWRPDALRKLAHKHCATSGPWEEFYFLRTHYAGGAADDTKLRAWLDLDECESIDFPRGEEWWMVLDYPELFDLGEHERDWQRVYDVFPELAVPQSREIVEDLRNDLSYMQTRLEWLVPPPGLPQEEDWAEATRKVISNKGNKLLIVDREAFETERLGLVFRDTKGNVVRHGRVRADELNEFVLYDNVKGALCETHFWLDSEVWEKYRVGGDVAREIVSLLKEYVKRKRNEAPER
jgi:hypothetical protein